MNILSKIISSKLNASVLIFLIGFAVYGNSFNNEFTNWDDEDLVVNNKTIRSLSIENVRKIFTFHKGSTYQPVRVFSYAVDYYFWKFNPLGYHIQNTLLHAFAGIFLFLALLSAIPQIKVREGFSESETRYIAFFTAILFIVHPVNVEAVAWLSGRKYVLLAFFLFLSFYLFVKSSEGDRFHWLRFAGSLFFCVLCILSSPFGIIAPALYFLFDYCRDDENNPFKVLKKRIIFFLPYILVGFVLFWILFKALVLGPGGADTEHFGGDPFTTLVTMFRVMYDYCKNFILPLWLNCRYPDYVSSTFWNYKILVTIVVLFFSLVFLINQLRKGSKKYLFPFCWFLIAWIPVSNIIPISTKMADRYVYIGGVGFFLFFSFLLIQRYKRIKLLNSDIIKFNIILICFIFLSVMTWQRNQVWSSSLTLWEDSFKKDPNNIVASTNLGAVYFHEKNYQKAIKYYKMAERINPEHFAVHNNLGAAYMKQGNLKKAVAHYLKDLEINPGRISNHRKLGALYLDIGDLDNALKHYLKVSISEVADSIVFFSIGSLYAEKGSIESAIKCYQTALKLDPEYEQAYYDLGRLWHGKNDLDKAEKMYKKALKIKQNYPEVYNSLGNIDLMRGKIIEAVEKYETAIEMKKNYPEAYYNMGNAFVVAKEYKKAIENYKTALRFDPDYLAAKKMIDKIEKFLLQRQ
jgi:protein O-mannosyl-transferase